MDKFPLAGQTPSPTVTRGLGRLAGWHSVWAGFSEASPLCPERQPPGPLLPSAGAGEQHTQEGAEATLSAAQREQSKDPLMSGSRIAPGFDFFKCSQ